MDTALLATTDGIFIEGIGHIGQWLSYLDCYYEKGVDRFVADHFPTTFDDPTSSASCSQAPTGSVGFGPN